MLNRSGDSRGFNLLKAIVAVTGVLWLAKEGIENYFAKKHPEGRDYGVDVVLKGHIKDGLNTCGRIVGVGAKAFRDKLTTLGLGNALSADIGAHYVQVAKLLDLPPTLRNLAVFTVLETFYWNTVDDPNSRKLGSLMSALQRYGVLMQTQEALQSGGDPLPHSLVLKAGTEAISGPLNRSMDQEVGLEIGGGIYESGSEHARHNLNPLGVAFEKVARVDQLTTAQIEVHKEAEQMVNSIITRVKNDYPQATPKEIIDLVVPDLLKALK